MVGYTNFHEVSVQGAAGSSDRAILVEDAKQQAIDVANRINAEMPKR